MMPAKQQAGTCWTSNFVLGRWMRFLQPGFLNSVVSSSSSRTKCPSFTSCSLNLRVKPQQKKQALCAAFGVLSLCQEELDQLHFEHQVLSEEASRLREANGKPVWNRTDICCGQEVAALEPDEMSEEEEAAAPSPMRGTIIFFFFFSFIVYSLHHPIPCLPQKELEQVRTNG